MLGVYFLQPVSQWPWGLNTWRCTLVPRVPSHRPVSDCLQYIQKKNPDPSLHTASNQNIWVYFRISYTAVNDFGGLNTWRHVLSLGTGLHYHHTIWLYFLYDADRHSVKPDIMFSIYFYTSHLIYQGEHDVTSQWQLVYSDDIPTTADTSYKDASID